MDIAALILALVSVVLICVGRVNVGYAVSVVAFICQWVHLTGNTLTVN